VLAGAALVVLLVFAPSPGAPGEPRVEVARPPHRGTVTRVYDGDTVEVWGAGKVRLIGVDAMDGYNEERTAGQAARYGLSVGRVRHWAERATGFARERLQGRDVVLHFGQELQDDHGRLLAYVHVSRDADGEATDFNLALLEEGLAGAYRAFPHPRRAAYLAAEQRARAARRGMWRHARVQR
jgi:endonuclease YncB( thermonuclease family)